VEVRYSSWTEFSDALAQAVPQMNMPREVTSDSARFKVLRGLEFFSEFTDAQLWEAIHISTWLFKSESEVVFEKGDPGGNLYVITSGEVVVTNEGTVLNRIGSGECFGEVAYLDEETHARSASVRADTGTVLLEIDAESLRQSSAGLQAVFGRAFLRLMVKRIKNADRRYLETIVKRR
jgi:non-specific serine/threonine protein kinase